MTDSGALVELAHQDAQLLQYRRQIMTLPKRIAEIEQERKVLQRSVRDVEAICDKAQKAARKIELEIEELKAKKAKSEARRDSITSTNAYQAVLRELEQAGKRLEELDTQLLESMERAEEAEKKRDRDKAWLEEEIRRLESRLNQLESDLQSAKTQVVEQESKRDAAVANVDRQTRSIYERVLKGKGNIAISLVYEKSCSVCNALQPPQVLQVLRKGDALQFCHVCGRILVMDPRARAS